MKVTEFCEECNSGKVHYYKEGRCLCKGCYDRLFPKIVIVEEEVRELYVKPEPVERVINVKPNKDYICVSCNKEFASLAGLESHKRSHKRG